MFAALLFACSDDVPGGGPAADAGGATDGGESPPDGSPSSSDGGAEASDASDVPSDGSADASADAGACLADAGGAGGGTDDQPFSCTPNVAAQGDPTYVLGGARPSFQGGVIQPGLYRATKATNTYVETAPGDCNGKTPPVATTYATELDVRPTHYLLRSAGVTIAGTWTSCNAQFMAAMTCPSVKAASGLAYTAAGNTILLDSGKTNYVNGGCRYSLQYELTKQ